MAGAAVGMMVRRARQDILRHFSGHGATAPEQAIAYDPDADGWRHARIRRRLFRRMVDFGVIRETKPGLFYLDEERVTAFRLSMFRRVAAIVAFAAGAAALTGLIAGG